MFASEDMETNMDIIKRAIAEKLMLEVTYSTGEQERRMRGNNEDFEGFCHKDNQMKSWKVSRVNIIWNEAGPLTQHSTQKNSKD